MLKEALKIVDLVRKLKIKVTSLSKNGFVIETDSDVFYKNLIKLSDALENFDNETGSSEHVTEEDKLRNSIVHLFKWLKTQDGVDIKEAHDIIKSQLLLEDKEDDEEIIRNLEEQLDYIPDDSLNLGEGAYANERKNTFGKDYTKKYPELEREGTFNNTYISPLASLAAVGKSIQEMKALIQEMRTTNDVENYLPELRSRLSFENKRIEDTLNEQNILDWELEKSLSFKNPDVLYNFSDDFEDNFGESLEINLGLLERQVGSLAGRRNSASSLKLLKITSMLHKCKIRIMEEKKHMRDDRYFSKLENDINRLEKSVYVYVLKHEHNNKFKENKKKKEDENKYENKFLPSMEFKPKNY